LSGIREKYLSLKALPAFSFGKQFKKNVSTSAIVSQNSKEKESSIYGVKTGDTDSVSYIALGFPGEPIISNSRYFTDTDTVV
jgi:hypothetical protein